MSSPEKLGAGGTARKEIRDARLGIRLECPEAPGERLPYRGIRPIPVFPEVRPDIGTATRIQWNLEALCDSIRQPGEFALLTCSCFDAGHAGIGSPVSVFHPDDGTVAWELDMRDYRPALNEKWLGEVGTLRLLFRRSEYVADISAIFAAVLNLGRTRPPASADDFLARPEELPEDIRALRLANAAGWEETAQEEVDWENAAWDRLERIATAEGWMPPRVPEKLGAGGTAAVRIR